MSRPFYLIARFNLLLAVVFVALLAGSPSSPWEPGGVEATTSTEWQKITASDGEARDHFGGVSVSGNTIVVSAVLEDSGALNAGAAYIFNRDEGGDENWGEVRKLLASDPNLEDFFGGAAISGDTVVAGASQSDTGAVNAGAAYVFERNVGGTDNWGEVTKLVDPDPVIGDSFGSSVAIDGDIIVVGASRDDSNRGMAIIFERDEGGTDNWGQTKMLVASDAEIGDHFGNVLISGDTIIVTATGADALGSDSGAAYVFQRDHGGTDNWGEVKKLTASDGEANDGFGAGLGLDGDTAILGAYLEDDVGANAGAAYVFQRNEGGADNWGEVTKLTPPNPLNYDWFGIDAAISGDTAVVGASLKDDAALNAGTAHVFRRNEGGSDNWGLTTSLVASDAEVDDQLGLSVALSGDTFIAGSFREDTEGFDAGAAYIYELPPIKDPLADSDGDTIIDSLDPNNDNDACSDKQENSGDPTLGGQRDPHNPWDFYDVLGPGAALPKDKIIDLPNDILGVIQHFAPTGAAPYDVQFDRGPSSGPNPWNMTAPDGVIDLPNDILGVINQFNHSCQ